LVWLKFLFCLVLILFAGTKLARYGDAIAHKTGLSGLWIGLVLLSAITSVPEIATGVSSAALVGSADLALGTLFGSNLFNLAILAFIDVCHPFTPILSVVSSRHILLAIGAMLLTGVAAVSILAGDALSGIALGWLGIPSIIILLVYLFLIRRMFKLEQSSQSATAPNEPDCSGYRLGCQLRRQPVPGYKHLGSGAGGHLRRPASGSGRYGSSRHTGQQYV